MIQERERAAAAWGRMQAERVKEKLGEPVEGMRRILIFEEDAELLGEFSRSSPMAVRMLLDGATRLSWQWDKGMGCLVPRPTLLR